MSAQEARVNPALVKLDAEIEPLVRLIEETPQSELLEKVAQRIHRGTTYQEIVAALFLASIRNVQPRPSVGFKFHAVMVMNAAHTASLASPDGDRWLPIFWALDYFKTQQAAEQRQSGWRMAPVDESIVPAPHRAKEAFIEAMEKWDEKKADAAAAGLARSAGANEIYEHLYRFGARDFRSIGHKAIFVAGSWRLLHFIGWQHAEPVLRSLAFALLQHELQDSTPALTDQEADRPWRRNQEISAKMGQTWLSGRVDEGATRDMLAVLREGSNRDTCEKAAELIQTGISPQSIWDALLLGAGELLMQQPGIVALHAMTSTNALHYAFQASGDERTRKLLLLQNCAFLPMFRSQLNSRNTSLKIEEISPVSTKESSGALDEIFADVSKDRLSAAKKIRHYLSAGGTPRDLMDVARRLIFLKGRDPHYYKFSCAVLEDYFNVSPAWRDRFLAASVFHLKGSGDRNSPLVERTRAAMKL